MKRRDFLQIVGLSATAGIAADAVTAQQSKIIVEEMMVPASDAGIEIFVRNKCLAATKAFTPTRTIVFVHGATYPARALI